MVFWVFIDRAARDSPGPFGRLSDNSMRLVLFLNHFIYFAKRDIAPTDYFFRVNV